MLGPAERERDREREREFRSLIRTTRPPVMDTGSGMDTLSERVREYSVSQC